MPGELLAELQHLRAQLLVASPVDDIPLTGRHDLEWFVALLEELHGVRDGCGVALHLARLAQHSHHGFFGRENGLSGDLGKGGLARVARDDLWGVAQDAPVESDDGAVGQIEFAPPDHVGDVTERTYHGDTRTLVGLREVVSKNRHLNAEDGRGDMRTKERLVAVVVRMRHESNAGGQQFGPRGLDKDVVATRAVEGEPVIGARHVFVFEFGLSHGRAERDIPQRGRHGLVGLAALDVAHEGQLRGANRIAANGAVGLAPVDREAERAPQRLKLLLVFNGELLAQLDEVAAADGNLVGGLGALVVATLKRGRESGLVGQRRVTANTVVVLHASLGGQAVIVPAHGVEDLFATHALVARHHVGVGVAEHVSHVQRTRSGGRRSVDRENARAGLPVARKLVRACVIPHGHPFVFKALECGLVGNVGGMTRHR
ncbi:unannotated protein [freshwater metagenome]|uniref:Unannotated protein n=1 Tax=freshwater metagenome TaxID=449393 RepID=A0A6J7G8K1_9ZZZZ